MTFGTVFTTLFILLLLTALVSGLVLYTRFYKSVEKRWATQVLNLFRDAERCIHSENRRLRELKAEQETKGRSLHEKAFAVHLCDYSVDELGAYPGIGPGTVGKLRTAGFVNLATLHRAHIRIHGLGKKRMADINYAVRNLLGKARSTFDAGGCQQTQALSDQLKSLSADYDRLGLQARTRARAAEEFINRHGKTIGFARGVRFWRWFRPISNEALVPTEVMEAPLPDLQAALREAEQQVDRSGTPKLAEKPPSAIPVKPISPPRQNVLHAQAPTAIPPQPPPSAPPAVTPPSKPAAPTRDECLSLLEIPSETPLSAELVRRQWNLLSERMAPEKVASMGAEFVKLAETKLAALRRAAELLLEAMGEKLETKPTASPVQDLRQNPDLDNVFGGM